MTHNYSKLSILFGAMFLAAATSCDNDDEPQMPVNAITLNMLTGDTQSTIGESDVCISIADNFTSRYCGICDLGGKGGFDRNPDLSQIAQEVAVTPGHYYQIIYLNDIKTVAQARALPVNAYYYTAYVDSWIYDKDNDNVGAKISYAECSPRTDRLPVWDTNIDIELKPVENKYLQTAEYAFPDGCRIDDNIEVYDFEGSDLKRHLKAETKDNKITFSTNYWWKYDKAEAIVLVRHESVFSRVRFTITLSD